jgi:putative ABC transport system permease protein
VTDQGSRLNRFAGVIELGFRRILGTLRSNASTHVTLSVVGVAIAVAMMTTVAGVSLGLASGSAIQGSDVDYWVVPEGATLDTIAVSVDGPRLGEVHAITDDLADDDRVGYATPVLVQLVPVRPPPATPPDGPSSDATTGTPSNTSTAPPRNASTREYVVFVGVVGPPDNTQPQRNRSVAGVPVDPLTPGDPYYANGTYDGEWTGEVVLSGAAAEVLNASADDDVTPAGTALDTTDRATERTTRGANGNMTGNATRRTFTVTHVANGSLTTGVGPAPVAVVHLAELQAATGAADGDQADQLLVSTNSPAIEGRIETLYPGTDVVTRAGLSTSTDQLSTSSLPVAMGVAGIVVSVAVGALFVATLFGLDVLAGRDRLAALSAIGVAGRSQSLLVLTEVLTLCLLGGVTGTILGIVGIALVNAVAGELLGVSDVAVFRPELLGVGLAVAVLIGLLAAPYPLLLSRRLDLGEVI